ncbi:HNH endonuclease [Streptomyces chryseus]|uniref:HNH endonuclease n=1 Tax=Streptomyces chryseus TaxID=68186 RepID=UPI00110FA1E7
MTPNRLGAPTAGRGGGVARTVAQNRSGGRRTVTRPIRITPPLRPCDPPQGPSHRDVLRRWEELEWWSCTYCDRPFGQMVVAEVDHIRPLARGGVHEWWNLAPSCRDCNRWKSDTDVMAWLVLAGHLATERDVQVTQGSRRTSTSRTRDLHK